MSANDPAFPTDKQYFAEGKEYRIGKTTGLTKRELCAFMMAQGFVSNGAQRDVFAEIAKDKNAHLLNDLQAMAAATNEQIALNSVRLADAVLAELEKANGK